MVDELQDTNRVQLELIDMVAVGQPVPGRRCAAVDLRLPPCRGGAVRAPRCRARGARRPCRAADELPLARRKCSSRSTGPSLARSPDGFRQLRVGREVATGGGLRVELLVVDKGAAWDEDGLAAPWRTAEARTLATRVRALIDAGECGPGDVVVLTRATTDLAVYERALEAEGVPTYVIGGRGYWSHPQVVELVAYLRALANPLDREAYLSTLVSPLVRPVARRARAASRPAPRASSIPRPRRRLGAFEAWFAAERRAAPRLGIEAILDRALLQPRLRGGGAAAARRAAPACERPQADAARTRVRGVPRHRSSWVRRAAWRRRRS